MTDQKGVMAIPPAVCPYCHVKLAPATDTHPIPEWFYHSIDPDHHKVIQCLTWMALQEWTALQESTPPSPSFTPLPSPVLAMIAEYALQLNCPNLHPCRLCHEWMIAMPTHSPFTTARRVHWERETAKYGDLRGAIYFDADSRARQKSVRAPKFTIDGLLYYPHACAGLRTCVGCGSDIPRSHVVWHKRVVCSEATKLQTVSEKLLKMMDQGKNIGWWGR